jgi:hypothetical protein
MIVYKNNVNFFNLIKQSTQGSYELLELGAGFFKNLLYVSSDVKKIEGIEIWEPYIKSSIHIDNVKKIHGDIRDYKVLSEIRDCVLICDVLEHFEKKEALELIDDLKLNFNKICLMIPKGNHPQDKDVTGFGAHEYQSHRSSWGEEDMVVLGFQEIIVDDLFHNDPEKDHGCMFCVWKK